MSNNFEYLSKYLEKLLKKDKNIYLLFVDGLASYLLHENGKNLTDEERLRIINVGISEQNAVSLAAGLALRGKIPYLVMFASFMATRAAEQVKLDVCYNNANVKLIGINAGFGRIAVAGYSHCTMEDIALFNALPNIKILSPSNECCETKKVMDYTYSHKGPVYVRFNCPFIDSTNAKYDVKINKLSEFQHGNGAAIISTGICLELAKELSVGISKINGCKPAIYSAHTLKPFDEETIHEIIDRNIPIITLEEHAAGGLASIVSMIIAKYGKAAGFLPIFVEKEKYNVVMYDIHNGWKQYLDTDNFYKKFEKLLYENKICIVKKSYSFDEKQNLKTTFKIAGLPVLIKEEREHKKKGRLKNKYYIFNLRIL